jgi:hypothetical protein
VLRLFIVMVTIVMLDVVWLSFSSIIVMVTLVMLDVVQHSAAYAECSVHLLLW